MGITMTENIDLKDLGSRLVEDSQEETFSARGAIGELFPYVFEASGRMSSRAISRWFEEKGVKLSAVTISKALRNPKPYWEELFETVEPAARIFEDAQGCAMEDFLLREEVFFGLEGKPPALGAITGQGTSQAFEEYERAVATLKQDWFCFPRKTREACLANVEMDREETATEAGAEKK
jgi:hypothetical protein